MNLEAPESTLVEDAVRDLAGKYKGHAEGDVKGLDRLC